MAASVSFHLKDPKADKPTAIFIWFNADGRRTKIYTGDKIHPAQWDSGEQQAKTRGRGMDATNGDLNLGLKRMRKLLEKFYAEQRAIGIIPTAEALRASIELQVVDDKQQPQPLVDFADYIERLALTRSNNTIKNLRTAYNHFCNFVGTLPQPVDYDSFTFLFYDKYTHYLLEKGQIDNTINRITIATKQFLQDAVDRGRTTRQDFKRWKWAMYASDIMALTRLELQAIEALELTGKPKLNNARGLFLLSCYTGLRFSDVAALKPEHDKGDRLQITTQKTRDRLTIPLHPKARPLLKELWANELHPISNQKLNEYLKELGKLAGIDSPIEQNSYRGGQRITDHMLKYEAISSHTGRRTFVTLALESGLPWEIVMKATGHKDFKSFRRYIHATEERQVTEFSRVWAEAELSDNGQ